MNRRHFIKTSATLSAAMVGGFALSAMGGLPSSALAASVTTQRGTVMNNIQDLFPRGGANTAYAQYFSGNSYLHPLSTEGISISNVTFEPGCRNNWHIHHATKGGGQILLITSGYGWYQEWDKPARALRPGDVVHIPAGVKHWHGASKGSWFAHLAVAVPGEGTRNEWLEPVHEAHYGQLG